MWLSEFLLFHWLDLEQVEIYLNKALAIDQQRADLHHLFSWVYQERLLDPCCERYRFMYEYHLKKAVELEPSWVFQRKALINLFIEKKEYKLAKQHLDETDLHCREVFICPEDEMQQYYEDLITGRSIGKTWIEDLRKTLPKSIL
jgi:hypothetical protein